MRSRCSFPNSEHNVLAKLRVCHVGDRNRTRQRVAAQENAAPQRAPRRKPQNLVVPPSSAPKDRGFSLGCGLVYFFVNWSDSGNLASASLRTEVSPHTFSCRY